MANIPDIKSFEQILGEMQQTFLSKVGINDMNTGSVVNSFFETMAQAIFRASGDSISILTKFDVNRAEGETLKKIAQEEGVVLIPARVSTGRIKVTDTNFEKLASKIYAGGAAPNIGTQSIQVSDASNFPATGSVYIGRGTPNVEGPIPYSSIIPVGGYYEIILSQPTAKFHNLSESVILAQGGLRTISSGTTVRVPASGASPETTFAITKTYYLLDGENELDGITVAAQQPGTDGNIPRGSIKQFVITPFVGASVTNLIPFSTGRNAETDDEIRNRIKQTRISRGLGTAIAIKNAVLGGQAPDEQAIITSNEVQTSQDFATLYIDNGQGYEEKTDGIGLEYMIDSALGGETHFQLATGGRQTSVVKAFIESNAEAPFNVSGNDRLAILIGGVLSEHVFKDEDFRSPGVATAYEIVASINANSELTFEARTANDGTKVRLTAKAEENEYIERTEPTIGNDVAEAMDFPIGEVETVKIYKNKKKLNKDGRLAQLRSEEQKDWASSIIAGDTLVIAVDNTDFITYTITDLDFIKEGQHASVSKSNSISSWVNMFNNKITGVTFQEEGNRIAMVSNKGTSIRSKLEISTTSSLVAKGMFSSNSGLLSQGSDADFVMSRNTAQIKLLKPLNRSDNLTAGTEFTRAAISSGDIPGGTVTLVNDAYFWFMVDNKNAEVVNTGVADTTFINVSKPALNTIRFTSSVATAFADVSMGDYVIMWSEELNLNNRLEGRIANVTNTYFDLVVTPSEYAAAVIEGPIVFQKGLAIVRTTQTPQKVKVQAGTFDINTLADMLESQIVGVEVTTEDDQRVIITTKTEDQDGHILLITFTDEAQVINFTANDSATSDTSMYAFYESQASDHDFPLFIHDVITSNRLADVPNAYIDDFDGSIDLEANDIDPNKMICGLHPLSNIQDSSIDNECVQIDDLNLTNVNIDQTPFYRRILQQNRYFVADNFDFVDEDSLIVVLDGDVNEKTFPINLYRKAETNQTSPISTVNFRAFDIDGGPTTNFNQFFGNNFSFKNYKVLMKARNVLHPVNPFANNDAILIRAKAFGRSGEKYRIGYFYPTQPTTDITHTITVSDNIYVSLFLSSGPEVSHNMDATTQWDVTVSTNVNYDDVTYTWNTIGTNPSIGASLSSGGYTTIQSSSGFAPENIGTFRVIASTPTSFTVRRDPGVAIVESNVPTNTNTSILLYLTNTTTAADIVNYIQAVLPDFVEAELIQDVGVIGDGDIVRSTYEDSNHNFKYIGLLDGINWIESSDVDAIVPNPNFTFKRPLQLSSFSTATANAYAFNAGEDLRIIPTTAKQLSEFLNVLAVTGFTTLGKISTSDRNGKLQFKTNILGTKGAIQVNGGKANLAQGLLIDSSIPISGYDLTQITTTRSALKGLDVGQYIKFTALNKQKKLINLLETTVGAVYPGFPYAGHTTIELTNREPQQLYFGQPKNFFRDLNRTFHIEKHGKLTCLIWDGQGLNPNFTKSVDINDIATGNVQVNYNEDTGYAEYTITTGARTFANASKGDTITLAGFTNSENNGEFKVVNISDNGLVIVVNNPNAIDEAATPILVGDIVISAEIQEGDNVTVGEPFAPLNRGTFRVIRRHANSIYIDNEKGVEEIVTVSLNNIPMVYDNTTQIQVYNNNSTMRIEHIGGTLPLFENAKMGDIVQLGADFNANNQISSMVTKSGFRRKEVFEIVTDSQVNIIGGQYLTLDLPNSGTAYYLWLDVNNSSVDPAPFGKVGIEVDVALGDSASVIAQKIQLAIDAIAGFTALVENNVVTVTCDSFGPTVNAQNINLSGNFDVTVLTQGTNSFIELNNIYAVNEGPILLNDTIIVHRPALKFSEYEITLSDDIVIIEGNIFNSNNKGNYAVVEVLNKNQIVIAGLLEPVRPYVLAASYTQLSIEEAKPYEGYKKIYALLPEQNSNDRGLIVFENKNQIEKISSQGDITFQSNGKLEFRTSLKKGLDAYQYHTGLIAEANRITYGDPRDQITYPGVSAAGAEIFIKPPLIKRITLSIGVRLNTGIPFAKMTEQVRTNVAALINGNPVGKSIAISEVVSTVNAIPGVTAVSIVSPTYNILNDIIVVNPSEKAQILDIVNDISVSKVGKV